MPAPNDFAHAFVTDGGELVVVSGRGLPFKYDVAKDAEMRKKRNEAGTGPAPSDKDCPPTFKGVFVRGDHLYVLDSSEYFWAYDLITGDWKKGAKLGQGVDEEDPGPWIQGDNIATPEPAEGAAPKEKKAA